MRALFIIVNILAAVGVVVGANIVLAIYEVHSFSVHQELVARGVLVENPVKAQDPEDPVDSDGNYDTVKRLATIGNVRGNLSRLAWLAAWVFVINGAAFYRVGRRPRGASTEAA